MTISSQEYNARTGLFYSRATRVKKRKQLTFEHMIFVNLYLVLGCKCVPIMLLYILLKINDVNGRTDIFYQFCSNNIPTTQNISSDATGKKSLNAVKNIALELVLESLALVVCLLLLIILSGDIELNPGPSLLSESDVSSVSSMSDPVFDEFNACLDAYTSFVHINIQSLIPKLDIINVELSNIDVLCFSETWLNQSTNSEDILLDGFHTPFRKDRVGKIGGGVAIYVKNNLVTLFRRDLDVNGLESLWVEIRIKNNKKVLVGVFYRPPDSGDNIYSLLEHSIDQAVDTGIENIVILGDFNEDYLKPSNVKMKNILTKYNLIQLVDEPTYFTENSNSCLDLVVANNNYLVDLVHVGRPFWNANVRFHCPTYGIMKIENLVKLVLSAVFGFMIEVTLIYFVRS